MNELEEARLGIASVDRDIAALFERRMELVSTILDYKKGNGLPILDARQEERVIANNIGNIKDPAIREYYVLFLREMMKVSKAFQARLMYGMRIAVCGEEGSSVRTAAMKAFPEATAVSFPDLAGAYKACEEGKTDTAILPLESSTGGESGAVMDLCFSGSLYINLILEMEHSRFGVFSRALNKRSIPGSGGEHFILVFTVRNEAGSLAKIVNIIGSHGFNMCGLHSRPAAGPLWNHYFFAELEGSVDNENGRDLLRQLESVCDRLKMAGNFNTLYL